MNQDQKLREAASVMRSELRTLAEKGCGHCFPQDCDWPNCNQRAKELTEALTAQQAAPYGYCPICGAKGEMRERRMDGNDTCANGHNYKSSKAVQQAAPSKGAVELPQLPEGKCVVRGPASAFNNPESGSLVDFDCEGPLSHCPEDGEELFTADQMQDYALAALLEASTQRERQWVGLTLPEVLGTARTSQDGISPREDTERFARAIEAKLREKNAAQREQPSVAGYDNPIQWGDKESERVVKVTRHTQSHYGYTEPVASSKPEPQAVEPEVFVFRWSWYDDADGSFHSDIIKAPFGGMQETETHSFITLQSHREAMAELERDRDEWKDATRSANQRFMNAERYVSEAREAIAKKDAALKAGMDAASNAIGCLQAAETEGLHEALAESTDWRLKDLVQRRLMFAFEPLDAAITQGQEALQ